MKKQEACQGLPEREDADLPLKSNKGDCKIQEGLARTLFPRSLPHIPGNSVFNYSVSTFKHAVDIYIYMFWNSLTC